VAAFAARVRFAQKRQVDRTNETWGQSYAKNPGWACQLSETAAYKQEHSMT